MTTSFHKKVFWVERFPWLSDCQYWQLSNLLVNLYSIFANGELSCLILGTTFINCNVAITEDLGICSVSMIFEQGRIFIVSNPLWHWGSRFMRTNMKLLGTFSNSNPNGNGMLRIDAQEPRVIFTFAHDRLGFDLLRLISASKLSIYYIQHKISMWP